MLGFSSDPFAWLLFFIAWIVLTIILLVLLTIFAPGDYTSDEPLE